MSISTAEQSDYIANLMMFSNSPTYGVTGPYSWTGNAGQSYHVQYSFLPALSYYDSNQANQTLTSGSQNFIVNALNSWSTVSNITFAINDATPSLVFSEVSDIAGSQGAKTEPYVIDSSNLERADVFLTENLPSQAEGGQGYEVILHEIGHVLGLSHPMAMATGSGYNADTTIMSYDSGEKVSGAIVSSGRFAITPMIYDIAAAQFLYGANRSIDTGFGGSSSSFSLDGSNQAWTIWDGGGVDDVLRVGATETRNATLDLRGGLDENGNVNWSRVGDEYVAIAFDAADTVSGTVTIENAIGGGGSDTFYGNYASNIFIGGDGEDKIIFTDSFGQDVVSGGEVIVVDGDTLDGNESSILFDADGSGLLVAKDGNTIRLTDWAADGDYGIAQHAQNDNNLACRWVLVA